MDASILRSIPPSASASASAVMLPRFARPRDDTRVSSYARPTPVPLVSHSRPTPVPLVSHSRPIPVPLVSHSFRALCTGKLFLDLQKYYYPEQLPPSAPAVPRSPTPAGGSPSACATDPAPALAPPLFLSNDLARRRCVSAFLCLCDVAETGRGAEVGGPQSARGGAGGRPRFLCVGEFDVEDDRVTLWGGGNRTAR